jgi:AbiV family abortive infection protein
MSPTTPSVTADFLLKGAVYSLEQCGTLLHDAVTLHKNGAHSSAIVLAAFAREELGRSQILLNLRKAVIAGKSVTLQDIKDKCQDHLKKQDWAQLSTVQRVSGDGGLAKLLRKKAGASPQSEDYKDASKQLEDITNQQRGRNPDARHRQRLSALYVEPTANGLDWNRPKQTSSDEATQFLIDAVNDYAGQYDRFQSGSIEFIDPELFRALQAWNTRPPLPSPEWPVFTAGL